MKVTRKQFLSVAATAVAGAAVSPRLSFAEAGQPAQSFYSADMFRPYLKQTFQITSAEEGVRMDPLDVTLETVEDRTSGSQTAQFSLEFMGPAGDPIASKTYVFRHPQLGALPMFVSPAHKDGQGRTFYRADFNILQNERSEVIAPPRRKR